MTKTLLASALAIALATHAFGQAGKKIQGETVDDSYVMDKLEWSGSGSIDMALKLKDVGGFYAVCAAITLNNSKSSVNNHRALQAIKIMVNRRVAIRGLHWAPRFSRGNRLVGKPTKCRLSKVKVGKNDRIGIELTRSSF